MSRKSFSLLLLSLLVLLAWGCSSGSGSAPRLLGINVQPLTAKVVVGETKQFTATGVFDDGSTREITNEVVWHSTDDTVASIDAQGLATGLKEGATALITATAGDITSDPPASLEVVSQENRLLSISVEPASAELQMGATLAFSATGTFMNGSRRDVTGEVTWTSSNPTVVAISNTPGSRGVAVGIAAGQAEITAGADDIVSEAAAVTVTNVSLVSLTVTPADPTLPLGEVQQFRATGTFSDDSTADMTKVVTWMSSNKVVADFSTEPGQEGLCTALAEGTTSITAISGSVISSPVTLQVTAATLDSLVIEPMTASLPVGTQAQFSATGHYSDGSTRDLTGQVQWLSGDEQVVAFSGGSPGLALGVAAGSAEVWASRNGVDSAHAAVTVTAATLEAIELSPAAPVVPVGGQLQLTAFGHYSDQSVVDITAQAGWNSADTSVATVSNAAGSRGLVTGLAAGSTTISATLEGVSGQQTLQVRDIEIASLAVTPSGASLPLGEQLQFTATATFTDGSQAQVNEQVTWHVGSDLVATISNAAGEKGLATAVGQGRTNVWCTSANGVASTPVELTVTSASLTSITIAPANPSVVVGALVNFTATGNYTDGSQVDLTAQVTWTSSDEAVATISNAAGTRGVATTLSLGVTFIGAGKDGVQAGPARLEVVQASLESIVLSPDSASIQVGETVQLTATGHYSDGMDRDISGQAFWSSSDTAVAAVSNAPGSKGLVTGTGQGSATVTASLAGIDSAPASFTVTPPLNQQPVAVLGGDSTATVGVAASFSGAGSYDNDGSIVNYTFNFGDGSGDVDNGTSPDITHVFGSANTYTVVLTVTDDQGASGSDTMQVVVTDTPNQAPTALLVCPGSGSVGQTLVFDASSSFDSDGTIVNYTFNFGDGTGDLDNGASPSTSHAYQSEGAFTASVVVTDDDGAQAMATCPVAIGAATIPEVRIIRPQGTVDATQGQSFNVLVDANGQGGYNVVRVELLADGVSQGEDTSAPYEFVYTVPGSAQTGSTITLLARAYDDNNPAGEGQSQPVYLEVKNYPPVADFTATISDALQVTVDASSCSDVETAPADLEVRWDWESDGSWDTAWSTNKVEVHNYPADGSYTITMQVRDSVDQTDQTSRTVDLASQQTVGGTVTTTTWYGTIIVTGTVTVPAGEVLTVNPNTQVLVMYLDQDSDGTGDFAINIEGELHVNGADGQPVLFSVYGSDHKEPGAWQGLRIYGSDPSSIDYAVVEYADVGAVIENDSTVSNSTFRFNRTGLQLDGADGAALTAVQCLQNEGIGLRLDGSANVAMSDITCSGNGSTGLRLEGSNGGSLTGCDVMQNGANGIDLIDSDLDIDSCAVTDNRGMGVRYRGGSDGTMIHSQITYNDDVGVRAESAGGHPHPVINYNNVYGNSVVAGTVEVTADPSATLDLSGPYSSGWAYSGVWTTPSGLEVRQANFEYTENYYASGHLQTGGGSSLYSASSTWSGWVDVSAAGTSDLRVALYQTYNSSSNGSNHVRVNQVVYSEQSASGLELSVSVFSGQVNARYNYWGAFPNVLDHISYNTPGAVDIQGFVGVAFDSSWDTGPYKAGDINSETWSGTVYITGDTNLVSGETLSIDADTQVLFVPIDQDFDGVGDYGLYCYGLLDVNGTAAQPVVFTALGSNPATASFEEVYVEGNSSTIDWAEIHYGQIGLEVTAAGAALADITIDNCNRFGLYLNTFSGGTMDRITASNNQDVGVYIRNTIDPALTYLLAEQNSGTAVLLENATASFTDCTVRDNSADGLVAVDSDATIDHSAFLYNGGAGIRFQGASDGSLTYSNVKYNDLSGVVAQSRGGHPYPAIGYCNLYGNSVVSSLEPTSTDPSATLSLTGQYSSGWQYSPNWSTPGGGEVFRAYFQYSENYYASGHLQTGDGSSIYSASSTWAGWVDSSASFTNTLRVALYQTYNSSSNGGNTVSVTSVEYLEAVQPPNTIEMTTATNSGTIAANHVYWGQQTDVASRLSMSRSDAVDFTSWELSEVTGCGPR